VIDHRVRLCDVTLRDGEQAADAAFTVAEKVALAGLLGELGVDQIQVGFGSGDGPEVVRRLRDNGSTPPLELLCIGFGADWQEQIEAAADAGADVVQVLMRSSGELLSFLGLSRAETLRRVGDAVSLARAAGVHEVVFGTSFSTQADRAFLAELNECAVVSGADRISIADTIGVTSPATFAELVAGTVAESAVPVGVHCHDDYGLAVACTLAGLEAGALWADVSVLGIGERCGNTALEPTALALAHLHGSPTSIDLSRLHQISSEVARVLKRDVPANHPGVGAHAFAQKLDLHVRVAAERPELFEPYDPQTVGNARVIRLGKGSGPHAVIARCHQLGLAVDGDRVDHVVQQVNAYAEQFKSWTPDDELERIVDAASGRSSSS